MTDGTGSGIVSASATGLGIAQSLELIPPHLLGLILSVLGIVSMIIIIGVNVLKAKNNMLRNKILRMEIYERQLRAKKRNM